MSSTDRVTNGQLRDAITDSKEVLRAEQKTEHFKTRMLVVGSTLLTGGTKLATAVLGIPFPPFHF
jgi:hypothetical protein